MRGDAICITTNGFVKVDGTAVMGAGIAKQAKELLPGVEKMLGDRIRQSGNHVHVFWELVGHYDGEAGEEWTQDLVSFPVKHHWREVADLELIIRSCHELMEWAEETSYWKRILLPRPGCGNGRLNWNYVKEAIKGILDERVVIVDYANRNAN